MSITAKVKYLKSVLRFLAIITVSLTSAFSYNFEDRNAISFNKVLRYYPILPHLTDPFPPEEKTLCLKSSHPFWNGHFLDASKKIRKIKKDNEVGLISGTFIMYHRFEKNNLQIPAVMTLEWYHDRAIEEKANQQLTKSYIRKIKQSNKNTNSMGKDLTIISKKIGNTDLEVAINGYITVNADLVFENKDLVTTNQRDSKNWDLEIEQTQRFNIMGNIGDRFFIDINQDSEADFTWENDLKIEYRGKENEIVKKAEAGNINLNLSGMDAVNMGGNNSSLFGIKAIYQLGPLEMQSVIAREQVKKSEKRMTGGMDAGDPISINDYDYIIDRYFFIDKTFKNNYYPLSEDYGHILYTDYVIGDFEVFQFGVEEVDAIYATAYVDPFQNETDSVRGNWKRLEENTDYEINRLFGYLRINSSSSQNAIAIAYNITKYDPTTQEFETDPDSILSTNTNFKQDYIDCMLENEYEDCKDLVKLKLIKGINKSTPSSPTWPLMFKNVYTLGGYNIVSSELEVEIVRDLGGGLEKTHDEDSGVSYLTIFGLDKENQNYEKTPDGKIDLYATIINDEYGELIFPTYLPFAHDSIPRIDISGEPIYNPEFPEDSISTYWGTNETNLMNILVTLNDVNADFHTNDTGPAMYYDNNKDNSIDEHEFLIKVKTSARSSSLDLGGFMIVEGSETVRLGSQILQKDVDYTIDYFSGKINFINSDALDPAAEISVSYEENQIISFDQKFLMGTYMKYAFGNNNYLAGGVFYYNQSIAEEKVDIGYEPMRNWAWNLTGKYQNEWGFLTKAIDFLPLIQTNKISKFTIEGNYAAIKPDPNPLGQAFIDDFESSKKTSSLSIMQRQWKMASPPDSTSIDSFQTLQNRGKMYWYNPYEDEATQNIWPELSTSNTANNNTTKILEIKTYFQSEENDMSYWNGIMIPLYSSEYNQSQSKYLDIWLNAKDVDDDELKLFIDIGHINEDSNGNGILDTEDEPVYGPGMGDGILSDGEDIGVDHCTNSYEDGWGGCLCNEYNNSIYDSDLNGIYSHPTEFCLDGLTYTMALETNPDIVRSPLFDKDGIIDISFSDPNGDTWCYNKEGCPTTDYSQINGTEGNGQAMGYRYPDTEDMDKNKTLDTSDKYFSISINPKDSIMLVTETITANGDSTGWKLFRMPLSSFKRVGDISNWEDVRSFRLRIESNDIGNIQHLKIAKIELVENEWKELGVAHKDDLSEINTTNNTFSVEVINTDESIEYKNKLYELDDLIIEHDEYNNIDMKEQSLVLSFIEDSENPAQSGIDTMNVALIKNTFGALSSDQSLSYFAYDSLRMYVYGGDPESDECNWCDDEESEIDLLFRFGKDEDDNYYEIRQHIYDGWDDRNHLDISISKLTQLKIPVINSPAEELNDVGLDGFASVKENGCVGNEQTSSFEYEKDLPFGGGLTKTYNEILDSLNVIGDSFGKISFNIEENDIIIADWEEEYIAGDSTFIICGQDWWDDHCPHCSNEDPNGDDYDLSLNNDTSLFRGQLSSESFPYLPTLSTENNNQYDYEMINGIEYFETAIQDYNGDGKYTPHPNYDYENNLYSWNSSGNSNDIRSACNHCNELRIKGTPSINNIQNIVMGVVNNSSEKIFGKVLVNELRMRGVKKSTETSYNIYASLDFADLMNISADYKHKDSGFHKLQQRLGTGSSDDTYSATIKLHPNIALPHQWGIKTPITFYYSNSVNTPKYHPGSDIIIDANDINYNIEDIQSKDEKITLSSSFIKSTRSTNWLIKRTIDNISLGYSAIKNNKSDSQIKSQIKQDFQVTGSYTYKWGKENYFSPFKFTKDWLILGNIFSQARYYYTPDKFITSIQFNESDMVTVQRSSLSETETYSFYMQRKFIIDHKFTKSFSSKVTRQIDSNLESFRSNKWQIIKDMNPGQIVGISEKFTNTYVPEFLKWLNPNITFNQTYTWSSPNNQTANIKSSPTFKTKIGLNIQDFIELIYTPENKGRSSKGRGRSRTSSNEKTNFKKIDIKNPTARFILGKLHSLASKLKTISSTYTYSTSHSYDNINLDIRPHYLFHIGIQDHPLKNLGDLSDTSSTNIVTSSHSYSSDLRTSTSVNITKSILTNLDIIYSNTLTIPSINSTTENIDFSYYPLGNRGDEGFPIANWSINWSKIEKMWKLENIFKSLSITHGFKGEKSMTYINSELQYDDFSINYSPLLGINGTTKGRNPITIIANYNLNQTIKNIDESTDRNHNNNMSFSIKFKKTGGLKINTFFFRDFYIRNNLDFALDFNYNLDRKLMTSSRVSNIDDFNEQTRNISWSIKPNVTYSFTRWITGNIFVIYGITESKTSGRNEERDFGFNMNIKIQG